MGEEEWKKVLYQKSKFPDNYTDSKFLEELKRNVHFTPVDNLTAITTSTRVSTQINISIIFLSVFYHLKNDERLWWYTYISFSAVLLLSCVAVFGVKRLLHMPKNILLLLTFGYACTPILKTLTDTVSTDTIYAMTAILMILHIGFHHYGVDGVFVSPYLSLNASMCAAISLASRLKDTQQAFILLTLAIEAFALFPELYEVVDYSLVAFFSTTIAALACTYFISSVTIVFYVMAVFCINIAFPLFFVWTQKFKDNIYGPWDEAMIFNK